MIITRFVKIQLAIFLVATLVGVTLMAFKYLQIPTLMGIGKMNVTLNLPRGGGLYRFGNVTYRGVEIGKVTAVDLHPGRVTATLTLNDSVKVPANLDAQVRSVSAIGEQYVDLRPRVDSAPYLRDGSVISEDRAKLPQQVGPMLKQLSRLVGTIPKDKLSTLLDESFRAFNGAGDDFGTLLDSGAKISSAMRDSADQGQTLIEQSGPLLETQAVSAQQIRQWAMSLAAVTNQVRANDPQLRSVMAEGPQLSDDVTSLLNEWKPTIPTLLANLTTIGQVAVTYNASLEMLLVLLPPMIAEVQAFGPANNPEGLTPADFKLESADPIPCTVGFLPPSQWRPSSDTSVMDLPEDTYCKLPQDSPLAVRGARNMPCMGVPGKRAPTVQICYSNKEYEPLAQRQPLFGPSPLDPNLVEQGMPPDSRDVRPGVDGYMPPPEPMPLPEEGPPALPGGQDSAGPTVTPSSEGSLDASLRVAQYDPQNGRYLGPDGKFYQQTDLAPNSQARTWKELLLH